MCQASGGNTRTRRQGWRTVPPPSSSSGSPERRAISPYWQPGKTGTGVAAEPSATSTMARGQAREKDTAAN